jgi:hypothetical protein
VIRAVCRSREKINENSRFCANFAPKMAKKGRKSAFMFTTSLAVEKCKLLIYCKLQEIKWSKKDFHRVGGVGGGWILGEETANKRGSGPGTENARIGAGTVII